MIFKQVSEFAMDRPTLQTSTWAVVPVKALHQAKQRLAAVLGARREDFVRALAVRTVRVLQQSGTCEGVLIVTPDPDVAADVLALGAVVVHDTGGGLNQACLTGIAQARQLGADTCLVVHADLALLTPAAVAQNLARHAQWRQARGIDAVSLVCCKDGTGTNLVILQPASPFEPMFGSGSWQAHMTQLGARALRLQSPEAAIDIDTEEDLQRLGSRMGLSDSDHIPDLVPGMPMLPSPNGVTPALAGQLLEQPTDVLMRRAAAIRDAGHGTRVTYSPKVFLPLTHLCRDSCHYCTFARAPRGVAQPYMSIEQVLQVAREGVRMGCKEALLTLGERPELRYRVAREWLDANGFASTLHYVAHVAKVIRDETGLLPHINAGCMSADEVRMLRPVCASMGLMLESTSERLCERGQPHHGSPDKAPAVRLTSIAEAGSQAVPFTTGILIGIGETRAERIEALLAIRALHEQHGHVQEVIIQNFMPKAGTRMAAAPPATEEELLWTIAVARILLGAAMSIQAPPNLAPSSLTRLVEAGINDWGGVSPLTPDFVNPEAPWPQIEQLRQATARAAKSLHERLTIYPTYLQQPDRWLDPGMVRAVQELCDGEGLGREDAWRSGTSVTLPARFHDTHVALPVVRSSPIAQLAERIAEHGAEDVTVEQVASLFQARGHDYRLVCDAADEIRSSVNGSSSTYVVNRNINYTNICGYRCTFCAFSKGSKKHAGAESAYLLDPEQIAQRAVEARQRGGTEVCLQGGIHPRFTGNTYLDILRAVKRADPEMHIHAFSPLEVLHGATTLGMTLRDYLSMLRDNGLGSLPGTAAEILHDPVRQILCPDKLNSAQWLEVVATAHEVGLRTTATIMFGHVDTYRDWAIHLLKLRDLQRHTGGFTEFVPLPFVAHEAPLYRRGKARPGPTLREAILMHAVGRLVLHPHFSNVQASWVKLGPAGMREALLAGANDLGGVLMDESITRAAGATHGQEMNIQSMQALAHAVGRAPVLRNTLYERIASKQPVQTGERIEPAREAPHIALHPGH
jgi:FO synthase